MAFNTIWTLIFVSFCFSSISAQYVCSPLTTINPPANINNSVVYPQNYDTKTILNYAANQTCQFTITVPTGTYAFIVIGAKIPNQDGLSIVDSTGFTEQITTSTDYFYPTTFNMTLRSGPNAALTGNFSFVVKWLNFPANITADAYSVATNERGRLLTAFTTTAIITADTKVSVMSIVPNLILNDLFVFTRSIMFFDGPNFYNSTYLGSFYSGVVEAKQIVSSSKTLSIYSLGFNVAGNLIVSDYKNVEDIGAVKSLYCLDSTYFCSQTVNATQKPGAIVTVMNDHNAEYLNSGLIDDNANLDIYIEPKTADKRNKIASYKASDFKTSLPQEILGTVRMYVISSGYGSLDFTHNSEKAQWNKPFDGRKGFVMSRHYMTSTATQKVSDLISSTYYSLNGKADQYIYTYMLNAQLVGNTTINVQITGGPKELNHTIESPGQAWANGTTQGTSFSVTYDNKDYQTTGMLMQFSMVKVNSAGPTAILLSTIISFYYFLIKV